jgi:two-component system sensor histidine kinase CpxA
MAHRLTGFVHGQKRFLGDIAHELCSPIARIQLALGILEQRADERQKSYVEDVREEVQHMSQLVNELLSFSKAELRRKEIQLHPVNLAAIAARVVDREAGGNSNVTVRIDPALEVVAQPDLLARALANVVRNALRYAGQAGSIVVSGRSDGHYATLSVSDQGPGLPAQELEKIFDPFYRLEPSRSRETGGSGLGLSIVKSCVEACQGKVTARNRQPSGLEIEMTFRTPAASADN